MYTFSNVSTRHYNVMLLATIQVISFNHTKEIPPLVLVHLFLVLLFLSHLTKVMFLLSVGVTEARRWHRFHFFLRLKALGHEHLNCCHPIWCLRQQLSCCGVESSGSIDSSGQYARNITLLQNCNIVTSYCVLQKQQ